MIIMNIAEISLPINRIILET